jgi:lipopolysaccharide transport system permease protein
VSSEGSAETLVIEASSPWRGVDMRELWHYRELLFFFVWRDVKVRYKQTTLGMAWAIIQPLMGALVFAFFFGRVAHLPSDGIPYPLFAYAGLLPWTFFANAVTAGSGSLIGSAHLITKVYFPRLFVPLSSVATVLVDFFFALLMLGPLLMWKRIVPSPSALLWIPIVLAVTLLFAMGLSIWLSALVARFRDLRHIIPFVVQLWMFATPIIYPLSFVPEKWRPLVAANPMAGVVETFRGAIFGRPILVDGLLWTAAAGVVLIVTGSIYFRRLERMVADVI